MIWNLPNGVGPAGRDCLTCNFAFLRVFVSRNRTQANVWGPPDGRMGSCLTRI